MYTPNGTTDKSAMVSQHMGMVKKIAGVMKSRLPASVELDDLIQAGTIGLWEAAKTYDTSHNATFETYANQRVRGAMLDELRGSDWAPRSLRSNMRNVEAAISKTAQRLGREPKESEVAVALGMPMEEYQAILDDCAGHQIVYLEDLAGGDEGSAFLDRHKVGEEADPLSLMLSDGFRAELIQAIESLPERERMVMALYYEQELNLKEIGAVLGVTEARVSQIHTQAVARIRAKLRG